MITKTNIKELMQLCETTKILCKQMIESRTYDSLFNNEKDFRQSKIAQQIAPDDYYRFRFFDTDISLRYNHRVHRYYVLIDSLENKLFTTFSKTFSEYLEIDFPKLALDEEKTCIVFRKEIEFDSVVDLYGKIILFYLSKKINNDVLFEVF